MVIALSRAENKLFWRSVRWVYSSIWVRLAPFSGKAAIGL